MTYDRWKTTNPEDQWLGPEPPTAEETRRAYCGIQCPECYGVRIEADGHRHGWHAFLCIECGCQWHAGLHRPIASPQ